MAPEAQGRARVGGCCGKAVPWEGGEVLWAAGRCAHGWDNSDANP